MAVNKDAIGILFGVAGGGAVGSESYKRINEDLKTLVDNINSHDPLKIKVQVDKSALQKEINELKELFKGVSFDTGLKISSLSKETDTASAAIDKLDEAAQKEKETLDAQIITLQKATDAISRYGEALKTVQALAAKNKKAFQLDAKGGLKSPYQKYQGSVNMFNDARSAASAILSGKDMSLLSDEQREMLTSALAGLEQQLNETGIKAEKVNKQVASSVKKKNEELKQELELAQQLSLAEKARMIQEDASISKRKKAGQILDLYMQSLQNVLGVRGVGDQLYQESDGTLAIANLGAGATDQHRDNLVYVVNDYNRVFQEFAATMASAEGDVQKFAQSAAFKQINTMLAQVTAELTEADQKAEEFREFFMVGDDSKLSQMISQITKARSANKRASGRVSKWEGQAAQKRAEISGLSGAEKKTAQAQLAKYEESLAKAQTDVAAQTRLENELKSGAITLARGIAEHYGEEYAYNFYDALQKGIHETLPNWKQGADMGIPIPEEAPPAEAPPIEESLENAIPPAEELNQVLEETKETVAETKQEVQEVAQEQVAAAEEVVQEQAAVQEAFKEEVQSFAQPEQQAIVEEAIEAAKEEAIEATQEIKQAQEEVIEEVKQKEEHKDEEVSKKKKELSKRESREKALELQRDIRNAYRDIEAAQKAQSRNAGITGDATKEFGTNEAAGGRVGLYQGMVDRANAAIKRLNDLKDTYRDLGMTESDVANITKLLGDMQNQNAAKEERNLQVGIQAWEKKRDVVTSYITRNEEAASRDSQAVEMMKELRKMALDTDEDTYKNFDALEEKFRALQLYLKQNGLEVETFGQKFAKAFGARARSMLSGLIIGKFTQFLRQIYTNVADIDAGLTQLKIVTQASDAQMEKFLTNSIKLSKELGSSIKDVLSSIETFSRLGYDLEESSVLAKYANIMSKVAGVGSEESTKGLTSIIKGYGFDPGEAERIADVLVEVGQKYAVSASELMEAFQKTGASLNASGTSFEKSAALIAAANAAIQDASAAGTALNTVSARIRKSKTDLDDLGESVDDLTESWSVYAKEIQALSGFNIMVEGTNNFKDIYEIFEGLAKVWGNISDETTRSRIAEILGGTRQYKVIASILNNWKDAAGAYADALNSAGASSEAMDTYMDSIQGKLGRLQASAQELSLAILDSDLVKVLFDLMNGATNTVTGIFNVTDSLIGLKNVLLVIAGLVAISKLDELNKKLKGIGESIKNIASFGAGAKTGIGAAQGVLGGITVAIGLIMALNNAIQNAQDEAAKAAYNTAEAQAASAKKTAENTKSLDDLIERYETIYRENGGAFSTEQVAEVKGIQDDITNLVKDQKLALDLVNGAIEDESKKLDEVREKQKDVARGELEMSLKAAEVAIMQKVGANHDSYEVQRPGMGLAPGDQWGFEIDDIINRPGILKGETADEFIRNYEGVLAYRQWFLHNMDQNSSADRYYYNELDRFINDFSDVYDLYTGIAKQIEELDKATEDNTPSARSPLVTAKSVYDILGKISGRYDVLTQAMSDMDEYGYISVKTFNDISENYEDLIPYLTQTADGYTLNATALEDYVNELIDAYIAETMLTDATEEELMIARHNLENLQTALAMLALSSKKTKSASDSRKDALEDEKDALKDQLDAYKKLIDLRKKLLETYKDELDYKKELEKKEQKVASLQTQVTVSRLDNSAAGRARTRELEAQLKEAQEELDDFTLEHAIDVVMEQLDNQYSEYEDYINAQLGGIENKLDMINNSVLGVQASITEKAEVLAQRIEEALANLKLPETSGTGIGDPENVPYAIPWNLAGDMNGVKGRLDSFMPGGENDITVNFTVNGGSPADKKDWEDIADFCANKVKSALDDGMSRVGKRVRGGGGF